MTVVSRHRTIVALAALLAACGSGSGQLAAELVWPQNPPGAAPPSSVDELRFLLQGGDGFLVRTSVTISEGRWRSGPLNAGRYRLEVVAAASGIAAYRASTEATVDDDAMTIVQLALEAVR